MCLAIPGKILSISGADDPLLCKGRVSFGGIIKDVSLACVPEAEVGQYVLVHVGLALSVVDEQEARRIFEYLEQMDELADLGPVAAAGQATGPGSAVTILRPNDGQTDQNQPRAVP